MHQKEAIDTLVADVLDGKELRLTMDSYTLSENFENGEVTLHALVHNKRTGESQAIESRGVGIVDAFFNGLVRLYSPAFQSLQTIRFADFTIKAKIDPTPGSARTDSTADVTLHVENSEGQQFHFTDTSASIVRSSISVVLQSVEFFINSERAFIAVYRALEHARKERRPDSIAGYTQQLATLVQATSYSEVIEQIRRAALAKE